MSDSRVPDIRLSVRLPIKAAIKKQKSILFELYLVAHFRSVWSLTLKDLFFPKVPLVIQGRNKYFSQELYRIRINGKWFGDTRYTFLEWSEIISLMKG